MCETDPVPSGSAAVVRWYPTASLTVNAGAAAAPVGVAEGPGVPAGAVPVGAALPPGAAWPEAEPNG